MRILVLLMLAVLIVPAVAQGEVNLDIGSDSGAFGDTVVIPITMSVTGSAPSTLVFQVNFDVLALAYQSYSLGSIVPDDKTVSADVGITGVKFVIYGGTSTIQAGRLMTLRFTVLSPSTSGQTVLSGVEGSASTPQASNLPVSFDNGSVRFGSSNGSTGCPGTKSVGAVPALRALPSATSAGAVAEIAEDGAVSLLLVADETIDASSVWCSIDAGAQVSYEQTWIVDADDTSRGWLHVAPLSAWPLGDDIAIAAGAATIGGTAVDAVTHTVHVSPVKAGVIEAMPGALGTWDVAPQEVYESPREVLLPLSGDSGPVSAFLFDGRYSWWEGSAVQGWLAEEPAVVTLDGHQYLRLLVWHGGLVAVAPSAAIHVSEAGVAQSADVFLVASMAMLLMAWRFRKSLAPVRPSQRP